MRLHVSLIQAMGGKAEPGLYKRLKSTPSKGAARMSDSESRKADAFALLDKMTAQELAELISAAERKRQEKMVAAKNELLAEFRARAEQIGLDLDALMPLRAPAAPRPRKDGRNKVAAKFRGPNGEEWTGRGKTPKWIETAEAEGKSRDAFAVKS